VDGPCLPWVTADDVRTSNRCADVECNALEWAVEVASDMLWRLSGRQFSGPCEDVVRPCRRSGVGGQPEAVNAAISLGTWSWQESWGTCGCGGQPERGSCSCPALHEVTLGAYPVRLVTRVLVDGEEVDPSAYQVHDDRWLVRVDGEDWPCCQDLRADPETDADTFQVEFVYGALPPPSGELAARTLACELARSRAGMECRLPQRVTAITRQGVSMAFLDSQDFITEGLTGIYEVDMFLQSVNPNGLERRAGVLSPDVSRPVRRVQSTLGS
jgi:hypothetical protein